jgi:hypothetical protein
MGPFRADISQRHTFISFVEIDVRGGIIHGEIGIKYLFSQRGKAGFNSNFTIYFITNHINTQLIFAQKSAIIFLLS